MPDAVLGVGPVAAAVGERQRLAVVGVRVIPEVLARVAEYARTTAGHAIAKWRGVEVEAAADAVVVRERPVRVDVAAGIGPVAAEVPAGVLVDVEVAGADVLARREVSPLEPVRLGPLIGTAHEAQIVGVEPGRLVADIAAEARLLSGDLADRHGTGVTAECRRRSVYAEVIGVRTLETVDVVFLQPGDRLGVALDVGACKIAADAVHRRQPPVVVEAAGIGVLGQERDVRIQLPVGRRGHEAQRRLVLEFLARAQHRVGGERLDRLAAITDFIDAGNFRVFARGHGRQRAQRESGQRGRSASRRR